MSPLLETMSAAFVLAVGLMTAVWLLSLARKDASVIDPFWGLGFLLVTVAACVLNGLVPRTAFLLILVAVWSLRLSVYLLWRNWGHGEDRRYVTMREKHGPGFWWVSLFSVFLLQGVILWFVSLPIQVAGARSLSTRFSALDIAGTVIWGVGLFLESVGDWQLARFKREPENSGARHGSRPVALHASPELLRRLLRLVGALPGLCRRRGLVDHSEPALHVHPPFKGLRSFTARINDRRAAPWL